MKINLVVQKTCTGYCAFSPDIPGCVATGKTLEHVRSAYARAAKAHLLALREVGGKLPDPDVRVEELEIDGVA